MSDLKDDAMFCSLGEFAKKTIETAPIGDFIATKVAFAIGKYFTKNKPFSPYRAIELNNYFKNSYDPKLEELKSLHDGKTSPLILMVLTLDYLVKERRHLLSRMKFGHFNIDKLIDDIYSLDKYKPYIKSHSDFVINL